MKPLLLIAFAVVLLVSACTSAQQPSPTPFPPSPVPALTQSGASTLLTFADQGYFFRVPVEFHAVVYGDSMCLSPYHGHEPPGPCHSSSLIVDVADAEGRTAADEADRLVAWAVEMIPDIVIERADSTIATEEAVILDGLPGVSSSRVVLIEHQDRLYSFTFMTWDPDGVEDFHRLEGLYATVTASLGFLGNE